MNLLYLLVFFFCALTQAQQPILLGYWYKEHSCDADKANGMYVYNVGDTFLPNIDRGAGVVYLTRPGKLYSTDDCSGKGADTQVRKCEGFGYGHHIRCVRLTG